MPHILLRFMAIEDENKLKLSRRIASSWVVISMAVAVFIGVVGNAMTRAGALEKLADSETIIVQIAGLISNHGVLAALLAGVILAGILAATMSTADSQLLAASSSISHDLGSDFLKLNLEGKKGMLVARGTMVFISLVAAFLEMCIRDSFKAGEALGQRLAVMHNLYFYNNLMAEIRAALDAGEYESFYHEHRCVLGTRI